jgi:hypothetical protein
VSSRLANKRITDRRQNLIDLEALGEMTPRVADRALPLAKADIETITNAGLTAFRWS